MLTINSDCQTLAEARELIERIHRSGYYGSLQLSKSARPQPSITHDQVKHLIMSSPEIRALLVDRDRVRLCYSGESGVAVDIDYRNLTGYVKLTITCHEQPPSRVAEQPEDFDWIESLAKVCR